MCCYPVTNADCLTTERADAALELFRAKYRPVDECCVIASEVTPAAFLFRNFFGVMIAIMHPGSSHTPVRPPWNSVEAVHQFAN